MSSTQSNMSSTRSVQYQYLKTDPEIPGQRWAAVSFAEPTNQELVVDRESFFASRFLKIFVEEHKQAIEFLEKNPEQSTPEIEEKTDLSYENIQKMFYAFRQLNFGKLQSEFEKVDEQHERLTMRAFKVRGVYYSQEDAAKRCHEMAKFEQASDVFTAKVGEWLPFAPANIQDVDTEHLDENLNKLLKSKTDEDTKRQLEFDVRKQNAIESVQKMNDDNDVMDDSEPVAEEPVELKSVENELFEKVSPETQQSTSDTDELDGFTQVKKRQRKKNKNRRQVNKRS